MTRLFAVLLLSATVTAPSIAAQPAERASAATVPKLHRLELKDESFRDALQRLVADHDMELVVIGHAGEAVTLVAEGATIDEVIRAAAGRAGYLASRDGNVWTLYGTGAEAQLAGQEVLYTHRLRAMTSERAADELQKLGVSGVRVVPVRELNGVFIRGPLPAVKSTLQVLESVDLEAPTVFVELLVVEYSHGKRFEWRFDVTNATYGRISDGSYRPPGVISGTYNFVTQIRKPFKFNLVALVTDDLARVVTNPHVAVQNGNPATIRFDHEEHVILTPPPASNAVTTSKIEVVTAPIELTITPVATGDGTIHLDVSGIVSFFVGQTSDRFSIDKHTVKSKVAVRDGETLILGGLIKEVRSNVEAGVPYLRRLPLVGYLFKDHDSDHSYSEVVIYVTPRLTGEQPFDEREEEETIERQLKELEKRHRGRGRRW